MGAGPDRLDRGTVLALVAMGMGVLLIANDFTALSVALPVIEKDLDSDVDTVQWVINGYALVFGVLIVTGGRLADMFGRKRMFFIGAGIFAGCSLLAGLAPSVGTLLAARAGMGVGGAMVWPAVLGMAFAALPDDKQSLAGALIIGVAGIGNAFGPLLGGFLTEALSWRWVFFVNLPVALFAVLVTWRNIRDPGRREDDARIDHRGVVTLSTGLVALLLALDIASDEGFGAPLVLVLFGVCAIGLVAFAAVERRAGRDALVPADVIRNADFAWACLAVLLLSSTFFTTLLFVPQFFQKLLGYDALEAGVAFLPFMATFALVSFASGPLYDHVGARLVLSVGAGLEAIGTLLLALLLTPDSGYLSAVPGMVVLGAGVGLFISSVTTAAVTALDPSRASLGGAILYMFQVAGGSVGLGLSTAVFATVSHDTLSTEAARLGADVTGDELRDIAGILAGTDTAAQVVDRFPAAAEVVTDLVGGAFIEGVQAAFLLNVGLAVAGTIVTVLFVGRRTA